MYQKKLAVLAALLALLCVIPAMAEQSAGEPATSPANNAPQLGVPEAGSEISSATLKAFGGHVFCPINRVACEATCPEPNSHVTCEICCDFRQTCRTTQCSSTKAVCACVNF